MKNILKSTVLSLAALCSMSSFAAYPGFQDGDICNGYDDVTGVVDLYTPAQTYSSTYGVYIRLKDGDGNYFGGLLYQRSSTERAYKQLTSVALVSLVTKTEVRMCYYGDDVYALELRG